MFVCPECGASSPASGFCTEHGCPLADAGDEPMLGLSVGSYRIARLIGRGGMGEVYLGVHPGIGSRVAIKVLSYSAADNKNLVERFFSEARAVNVIRHEGIVNVLDLSVAPDGRPYIAMEYLEGAALSAHLEHGALPLGTALRLAIEVLDALAAAHAEGITHRDLKPDNIFVTALGRAKVLDFGIAKLRPELGAASDGTRTGALLGTPAYMSPEQALGRHVDPRTDIYAMGVILFEAITGRRLFDAESLFELLRHQIESPPPSLCALRPEVPPGLEAVVLRALEKDPARRFGSAAEMARALDEAARSLPPEAFAPFPAPGARTGSLAPTSPLGRAARYTPLASAPPAVSTHPSTRADFSRSLAREPDKRGAPWLLIGAAGFLLLVVVGLSAVAAAFYLGRTSSGPTAAAQPAEEPLKPFVFDSHNLDAQAFVAHARGLARQSYPDAKLAMLSMTGVRPDGSVDLSTGGSAVTAIFISEKAASRITSSGGVRMGTCAVSVSAVQSGVYPTGLPSFNCDMPVVGVPRCSVKKVVTKAASLNGKPTATVTLSAFGNQGRLWMVLWGSEQHLVPDDC